MIDLSGKQYTRWRVISFAGKKNRERIWQCECLCGTKRNVSEYKLIHGKSKSCGCMRSDAKFQNEYNIVGNTVYVKIRNTEQIMLCDLDDWEKLKKYCWNLSTTGYAYTVRKKKHLMFHTLIIDCPDSMERDHINRNKLDNRKENIRLVKHGDNILNISLKKNNKSGHNGVYYDKARSKWAATITVFGRNIALGRYDKIEDAVNARKQAEIKYRLREV